MQKQEKNTQIKNDLNRQHKYTHLYHFYLRAQMEQRQYFS